MSLTQIACLAVGVAVAIVAIFALAGGVMPGFAGTGLGQMVLATIAAALGVIGGNMAYQKYFPGR